MKLIPEIEVTNGMVVEPITGRKVEPIPLFRELESKLSREEDAVFYVVDMEGMKRNRFDMNLLERLGEEFRIWFKGGFRKADFLMDALILGAEVAVMDTSTMLSMSELERAVSMSDSIALSIEPQNSGWNGIPGNPADLVPLIDEMNLHSIIIRCTEPGVRDISTKHRKYSHGCGENGFDGLIVPYTTLLQKE